ncbi:DUF7133 domain-containing protein [Marinoscillum furvescens]|uniref:Cytochrome c domain-containing protein n=1 Tax=Marinoscillum furvescens DSM 4134 TaxID=1122208 RepID=A0A3D9LG76_MARFU|nr:c-type cytochrome [Marinoscillum furvescens]REE05680.1 hypothetical protein C7460_101197 [Marinoscillum furvescens DSM 4134]
MHFFKQLFIGVLLAMSVVAVAQPTEDDYYKIVTIPVPEGILLEVGGVATLPDGRIALATRRGDVWLVENPTMEGGQVPNFTLFATGLHEPLGLAYYQQALYATQRGELTRLRDTNGDDRADSYETVYSWPLSGHYHEYSYGPKIAPDGSMFVTGNVAFGDEEWWRGESRVPWRGWTLKITPDGEMEPWATGMRSPCGIGLIDGEFFYADNQGDWMGSGGVWHVEKGDFTGHPAGLRWSEDERSPVQLTEAEFSAKIDHRKVKKDGRYVKPENIADEENPWTLAAVKKEFDEVKLPAVWLPHAILGISNSEILKDETGGAFGPFAGQIFVGDQGQSKIMRVVLEEVNGAYQGVAFDFREGFQSGVLRMDWGNDGSLYVGETNRGWGSAGNTNSGFERLVWIGDTPMEIYTVSARPDGFELFFTLEIDKKSAADLDSYNGKLFTYKYHPVYGSPTIGEEELKISGVKVADDGKSVRLLVDNMKQHFIHQINVPGIRSADKNMPVLHPEAYYTLNNIPDGERLDRSEVSTRRSSAAIKKPVKKPVAKAKPKVKEVLSYEQVKALLDKNACSACHKADKRVVGPSFADVAKRRYTDERIVELIYNPEPENWPGYATPMAPMPQVPRADAQKIAQWINSLRGED